MAAPPVVDGEANGIQQLAVGRNRQQAQHVTILMDAPAHDVDQPLVNVYGAAADGESAVAVLRGPRAAMDARLLAVEPTSIGDTTEDTDLEDSDAGDQISELAEDGDALAHEVEPPALDFGWGIVVGELTGDDFAGILSMPKL